MVKKCHFVEKKIANYYELKTPSVEMLTKFEPRVGFSMSDVYMELELGPHN